MDLIEKARKAIGKNTPYVLGAGGYHPEQPLPGGPGGCDCSGFIAWLIGISRDNRKGQVKGFPAWFSTDSIYADAVGKRLLVERIPFPEAGCFAVYPDHKGADGKPKQGHVALVVDPKARTIIDCSSSHKGITEHVDDMAHFFTRQDAIFCRLKAATP